MADAMVWEKQGRVFVPMPGSWMHAYAQVPTPLVLDDRIRIYFGCRPRGDDPLPVSQIAWIDVARDRPTDVIRLGERPAMTLGGLGCFDEFGLHPLSVVTVGDEIWLYYVGWTRMVSVPFNRAIGLAISRDGGLSFERYSPGPLLGATPNEPYLQQGPHVQRVGDVWHMWYLTGIDWIRDADGRPEAIYQIVHATSADGIDWRRDGRPIIEAREQHECQAGQAVLFRDGVWHMWFSYRRGLDFRHRVGGYRIGYAFSHDLEHWQRDDSRAGIGLSAAGWDSEMVCYPNVVDVDGRTLMFYSGNYFGRDGFGYAVLRTEGRPITP